jgi:hypothetical protein
MDASACPSPAIPLSAARASLSRDRFPSRRALSRLRIVRALGRWSSRDGCPEAGSPQKADLLAGSRRGRDGPRAASCTAKKCETLAVKKHLPFWRGTADRSKGSSVSSVMAGCGARQLRDATCLDSYLLVNRSFVATAVTEFLVLHFTHNPG